MHVRLAARALFVAAATVLTAASGWAASVTIDPSGSLTLPVNESRQFTAKVNGASNTGVKWSLIAPPGVSQNQIGTIDSKGKYKAPASPLPGFAGLTVRVTSVADPLAQASNSITIRNAIPTISSVTPGTLPPGPFALTINGSGFVNGAQVLWNGVPLSTTYASASKLKATGTAGQTGSNKLTVANPGPGASSSPYSVTVASTVAVSVTPANMTVPTGGTVQFQATVTGSPNQTVSWSVVGSPAAGTIDSTGKYTAPVVLPLGGTATISAVAAADGVTKGSTTVFIADSQALTYGRFLEQATYGPTSASLARVKQLGIPGYLNEQFAMPESAWPPLATSTRSDVIDAYFANALKGQDQLRQRMIGALSEIIVVAFNKNTNANEVIPWLQLLSRNAFGNYRTLLKEITLDASMGKYLDLANSGVFGGAPNENYPREVMQLFSIGLSRLNVDGSVQTDANGVPIPTYSQTDVQQLAKALTGWTNSNNAGTSGSGGNYNYYPGSMIPVPSKHDYSAKTVLGQPIPANQTIQQDLDSAIDIIFNHPNVGPFLATRLIRALVVSNPSPAYIARVAQAFNGTGSGVRGDMKAVIKAILLDPEARNDAPPSTFGRLRSPVQHTVALARALNIDPGPASQFAYLFYNMNEGMLDAPSVFGHFSPLYRIPGTAMFGPEFQIYSASDAINRANLFYSMVYNPWPINPALQPYVGLAGNAQALVNAIDQTLLYGRMPASTRTAILGALPIQQDNNQRVLTAFYLTFTSGEFLVQH